MASGFDQLRDHLFIEFPRLVTGIGIGSQPSTDIKVKAPADQPAPPEPVAKELPPAGGDPVAPKAVEDGGLQRVPEAVIFVEAAPDCELEKVRKRAQELTDTRVSLLRTGRFYGLQATTGGSTSFYTPFQFNLPEASAGTLGAVAEVAGKKYALCSNHAIAHNGRVPMGAPVVGPGTLDGPPKEVVGSLSHFIELKAVNWPPPPPPPSTGATPATRPKPQNTVDCALAEIPPQSNIFNDPNRREVKPLPGNMTLGTGVKKTGRTTGKTSSDVRILQWEGYIDMSFGSFYFEDMICVVGNEQPQTPTTKPPFIPFAAMGDSGALVLSNDLANQAVGLVTARAFCPDPGQYHGYVVVVCPINSVLQALAAKIPGASASAIMLSVNRNDLRPL